MGNKEINLESLEERIKKEQAKIRLADNMFNEGWRLGEIQGRKLALEYLRDKMDAGATYGEVMTFIKNNLKSIENDQRQQKLHGAFQNPL